MVYHRKQVITGGAILGLASLGNAKFPLRRAMGKKNR